MRIIRPYGQSVTRQREAGQSRRRALELREALRPEGGDAERDIVDFAGSHDALVIAQWISTIDKIATKPRGNAKPTSAQRDLRAKLGSAAWALIVEHAQLPGLASDKDEYLGKLWRFKIAPYPDGVAKPRFDPNGKPRDPRPEGRWYARFAGGAAPEAIDAPAVARRIFEHLHEAEYPIYPRSPKKRRGRIVARAESIKANVLRRDAKAPLAWSADDRTGYESKAGNIAAEIRDAAIARENGDDGAGTRRVGADVAGKVLFEAWSRLFGGPLSFAEARSRDPARVDLHEAIRAYYRGALKRHGKDQRSHGEQRRKVSSLLPTTMAGLFRLVDKTQANRDLNALIRLGKVIHYEAAARAAAAPVADAETTTDGDAPAHVISHWPHDVDGSRYWTSDGQAEIKRNEAFVRVWRHSLALAAQTLRDWADPQGQFDDDILLSKPVEKLTGELFDPAQHTRKLQVLFGARADIFLETRDDDFPETRDEDFQRRTLRLALQGTAQLRHRAFHFTGLGGFTEALRFGKAALGNDLGDAIGELWVTDIEGRAGRLRQTMEASHLGYFFNQTQNQQLFDAAFGAMNASKDAEAVPLPLPRFRRLLDRAAGIGGKGIRLRLPGPANRQELEDMPARLCQYVALKHLYEHPFRTWIGGLDTATLNDFIERAVARSEGAAKTINAKGDADRAAVIKAKARDLVGLAAHESIQHFLFRLSAETASEMRVQRGYESDAQAAKEQAGHIENLRLDVLAQAFDRYLEREGFRFVTDLPTDAEKPATPLFEMKQLPLPDVDAAKEDWQALLYFLLHLMPVDDVGRLLHQIRKWDLLAGKGTAEQSPPAGTAPAAKLTQTLELYLDMHDAKFEGDAALSGVDDFKMLFESEGSFDRLFTPAADGVEDTRLPRRGLREVMRFGHLPPLRPIFQRRPIADAEVEEVVAAETGARASSPIAQAQAERELLHEKWSRDRKRFKGEECQRYVEALGTVMNHRHSAAHVMLNNHVRLHRLMMAVLGRLLDFSGLWERDLYFATLALLHQHGLSPGEALNGNGRRLLSRGQIVDTRKVLNAPTVKPKLFQIFGDHSDGRQRVRNDLAHFNMLNAAKTNGQPPDLTAWVNATRLLMSHDRKLKNAVAQSIIELLQREGFDLSWDMDASTGEHRLTNARLAPRQATHLGGMRLPKVGARKGDKPRLVRESLHGHRLVDMVADLFAGTGLSADGDVSQIPIERIDWGKVNRPKPKGPHRPKGGNHPGRQQRQRPRPAQRPAGGRS